MTRYRLTLLGYHANLVEERRFSGEHRAAIEMARQLVSDGSAVRVDLFRMDRPDTYGEWVGTVDGTGYVPPTDRRAWMWG